MPSQTIRAFGEQSRTFGRRTFGRFAVLLAVLSLLTATFAALVYAATPPQKDRQSAARKAFDEGERLRQQAKTIRKSCLRSPRRRNRFED